MATGHIHIGVEESRNQHEKVIPLLKNPEEKSSEPNDQEIGQAEIETILDKTLQRLDLFLSLLGFNQSSVKGFLLSWGFYLLIGIVLPFVILDQSDCPGCEKGPVKIFEIVILVSHVCLGAACLICLSHNLRKYGIRKFLFVDRHSGHLERFSDRYVQKIWEGMRLLVLWVVPCCLLKTTCEVIRLIFVRHESWWKSAGSLLGYVFSWTYITTVFLTACILFHVVCNLQVIHFEDYGKLLQRETDVLALMQEHARLRYYLSKISHRFRIYLLLEFLIVTISQFMTLLQTTGYNGSITFLNGGDFAASSVVQVVGIILCLNAAAKISHRAQGIGAIASRWHALVTCSAGDGPQLSSTNSTGNLLRANNSDTFHMDYSESDLESLDFMQAPTNTQLASYMSTYHKRLALVMYLQSNSGGITIFGWTVDRGLINTIFFLQLSLVTFVLSRTVVLFAPGAE